MLKEELVGQIERAILGLAPLFDVSSEELAGFRKPAVVGVNSFFSEKRLNDGSGDIKGAYCCTTSVT